MGAVFEGSGNGSAIIQNAASVNAKANELNELVGRIAQEVLANDEQIRILAQNGITGSAMTKPFNTYVTNRETPKAILFSPISTSLETKIDAKIGELLSEISTLQEDRAYHEEERKKSAKVNVSDRLMSLDK